MTKPADASYWKYRLAHERAAHRATKRERNAAVNDLVSRLTKARKQMTRIRKFIDDCHSCF
jgi:arginyl-tRNA--protein-N-Asp/Glu arginylyltransferase